MSSLKNTITETADFQADYLNYLNNTDVEKLLVVETLSQRNQKMAVPKGPCACDGCEFVPPTPLADF